MDLVLFMDEMLFLVAVDDVGILGLDRGLQLLVLGLTMLLFSLLWLL